MAVAVQCYEIVGHHVHQCRWIVQHTFAAARTQLGRIDDLLAGVVDQRAAAAWRTTNMRAAEYISDRNAWRSEYIVCRDCGDVVLTSIGRLRTDARIIFLVRDIEWFIRVVERQCEQVAGILGATNNAPGTIYPAVGA